MSNPSPTPTDTVGQVDVRGPALGCRLYPLTVRLRRTPVLSAPSIPDLPHP